MAKYTTVTTVHEIDFVGHIWQPGVGLCVGRSRPKDADVAILMREAHATAAHAAPAGTPAFEEAMRQIVAAYLKRTEGDFSEIVDFRVDFGDTGDAAAIKAGTAFYSEWKDTGHEMAFEDADGYDIEDGDGWSAVEDSENS